MALPTNRIKKIKLPDNSEYEIVPERLGKNGVEASLPSIFWEDSTLTIERTKTFSYSTSYLSNGVELYFGQVKPDNLKKPWCLEYNISVTGSLSVTSSNQAIGYYGARVIISSSGGYIDSYDTYSSNNVSIVTVTSRSANVQTSGSITCLYKAIFRPLSSAYYDDAVDEGFGHLLAVGDSWARSFGNTNTLSIKVTLIRQENCYFEFLDDIVNGYTNTPVYQFNSSFISTNTTSLEYNKAGLNAQSITDASNTVSTYNYSRNVNYYFTGATGTGTGQLGIDTNKYFRNGNLYLYGGSTYVDNLGFGSGTYYYGDGISYYDGDADDSFYLNFPAKAGTIALTSDITNVPIEDLTNVQPTPTAPSELFCYDDSDTMPGNMTIRFSKGFIPTSITATESYYNPPSVVSVTLHYDESNDEIIIDSASNCDVNSYGFYSEDNENDYCYIYLNNINVPFTGNPPQVHVEGTFIYKSGSWSYEL